MTVLVKPIYRNGKESTEYRINSLFKAIQKTDRKVSDFAGYLLTPLADLFILDALLSLNASINFMNASLSVLNAIYIWTSSQQNERNLFDERTVSELGEAMDQFKLGCNDIIAAFFNPIISVLCLVTRPIASVVQACVGDEPHRVSYAMR